MLGRHEAQLMATLEEVSKKGWAFVEWWKLYLWYGVKKIRKEPYRDIKAKAEELGEHWLKARATPYGLLLLDGDPKDIDDLA